MKSMMTEYMNNDYDSKPSVDNKTLASLTHILGLLTWVFGPIIVYFMSDDEFVKQNAANAFSWQLFMSIYVSISFFLLFFFIGFIFLFIIPILNIAFPIIASIRALEGDAWKYPATTDVIRGNRTNKVEDMSSNEDANQDAELEYGIDGSDEQDSQTITEDELFEKYLDGEITEDEYERRLKKLRKKDRVRNMEYN